MIVVNYWVRSLHTTSSAWDAFRCFIVGVATVRRPGDYPEERSGNEFSSCCTHVAPRSHAPGTPQYSGVAERALVLLKEKLHYYWAGRQCDRL